MHKLIALSSLTTLVGLATILLMTLGDVRADERMQGAGGARAEEVPLGTLGAGGATSSASASSSRSSSSSRSASSSSSSSSSSSASSSSASSSSSSSGTGP